MNGLTDGVALVTGGGSGIGRAIARRFAHEGARVAVADVNRGAAEGTVETIENEGGDAAAFAADVSSETAVASLVDAVTEQFGGLDFAANNAGVEGDNAPIEEQSVELFDRVIGVNLRGTFLSIKHELPHLRESGGAIVNTASVAGLVGAPDLTPYYASKHGVVGLTRSVAAEAADDDVRVNAVCPGVIDTPMVDRAIGTDEEARAAAVAPQAMERLGTPEEVAGCVVWLCSDDASFVTGTALPVDGGYVAQ